MSGWMGHLRAEMARMSRHAMQIDRNHKEENLAHEIKPSVARLQVGGQEV